MAKVTEARWNDIKLEYLAGMKTKDIASKYDIEYGTLSNKISKDGWSDLLSEAITEFNKNYPKVSSDNEIQAIADMKKRERDRAETIAKAVEDYLIIKDEEGNKVVNPIHSPQNINHLATAIEKVQKVLYKSHGITDKLELDAKITLPTEISIKGI